MKSLKDYIFCLSILLITFFVMSARSVMATDKVVINANSNGEPSNVYKVKVSSGIDENHDGIEELIEIDKQFTRSRDITVTINLEDEELANYDTKFGICEVIPDVRDEENCAYYLATSKKQHYFQLSSADDGEKRIKIYFYINYETKQIAETITKAITVDTTGPIITLTGGEYVFIPLGKTYEELNATCVDDSEVIGGDCTVTVEEANIDMNKEGYQYIRYTATDFLGNEVNAVRKIMVEMKTEERNNSYWIYAGIGIAILAGALFVVVLKNKEKQKKQSIL